VAELLREPPFPPRDERRPDELFVSSVRLHGVISPILVRRRPSGPQVVCGYRRLLAARDAGLVDVPVISAALGDAEAIRCYLSENTCRYELSEAEREAALLRLRELRDAHSGGVPGTRDPASPGEGDEETGGTRGDLDEDDDPAPPQAGRWEVSIAAASSVDLDRSMRAGGARTAPPVELEELVERTGELLDEVRERRFIDMAGAEAIVRRLLDHQQALGTIDAQDVYAYHRPSWLAQHSLLSASLCASLTPASYTPLGREGYALAGLLHDAGMVFLDSIGILGPRRTLGARERRDLRSHTRIGHALITAAGRQYDEIALAARDHHERLDGSGYPGGLRDHELGRLVRVVALSDSYASMVGRRSYRRPLAAHVALERLGRATEMGLYDPSLFPLLREAAGTGIELGRSALRSASPPEASHALGEIS